MSNTSPNNNRIAKNTIFLYIRMLLTMAVTLYTSRVVLDVLGVEDFGIYNVVGGVVTMFAFLNGTISGVTQRYITYELGTGNKEKLKSVFSTAMCIHWLIAILILLLAETIGLWFVYNKLVIPDARMTAAVWVYQLSILSTIVFIISVPYNACIIAHEKMSAFAYISIVEVLLKLIVVIILKYFEFDKLIFYAILIFAVQLIIRLIYNEYCKCHFEEANYQFCMNHKIAKSMLGFTGWSLFGGFASVGMGQGVNILLNIFFGPSVNAARAIAMQVDGAVSSFCQNFQMAMNPQIIKNYASKKLENMHDLVFASSKFSFFLLLLLSLPIIIKTKYILELWLMNVPDHAVAFLKITLLIALINSLATPLMTSANATGKIKKYQVVCGLLLLIIIPLSYFTLKLGGKAEIVFLIHLFIVAVTQIFRILIVGRLISMSLIKYLHNVILPVIKVTIIGSCLPILVASLISNNLYGFILVCLCSSVSILFTAYFLGINSKEREFLVQKLVSLSNRLKKL